VLGERKGGTAQSNAEAMLSAAVNGYLETSCPSTDLALRYAISFYTASSPQGFAPWGGRAECAYTTATKSAA